MKVLNLYAGIGGNRKLWQDCDVTAIENVDFIADAYQQMFPNDTVIQTQMHYTKSNGTRKAMTLLSLRVLVSLKKKQYANSSILY